MTIQNQIFRDLSCGELDSFVYIESCEVLQDLIQEFQDLKYYDLIKMLTYYQSYITLNFLTQKQLKEIFFRIKSFHQQLLKGRIEIPKWNEELLQWQNNLDKVVEVEGGGEQVKKEEHEQQLKQD